MKMALLDCWSPSKFTSMFLVSASDTSLHPCFPRLDLPCGLCPGYLLYCAQRDSCRTSCGHLPLSSEVSNSPPLIGSGFQIMISRTPLGSGLTAEGERLSRCFSSHFKHSRAIFICFAYILGFHICFHLRTCFYS